MGRKPFYSIVIPTYNRAHDLKFALFCILRQSYSNFEIVVSDNCSTDDTKKIVSEYKDRRIKYFRNKKNLGVKLNLRKAVKYAKGEYTFLHSDDDFLLYRNSLEKIHGKIKEKNPGYIRINYLTRDPSKKKIFSFHSDGPYLKDTFLRANSTGNKIWTFLHTADSGFISGVVFKNNLPKDIEIIESDIVMWVKIIFCSTELWGGQFISKPYIIAGWSKWSGNINNVNPLYNLVGGRITSEEYLNFLKEKLDKRNYQAFLHTQLFLIYVKKLPAIKYYVGNNSMLQLTKRLRKLDSSFNLDIFFWMYLGISLLLPRFFLKLVKDIAFYKYSNFSEVKNAREVSNEVKNLEEEYVYVKNS